MKHAVFLEPITGSRAELDVEDVEVTLAANPGWELLSVSDVCPADCPAQLATGVAQ